MAFIYIRSTIGLLLGLSIFFIVSQESVKAQALILSPAQQQNDSGVWEIKLLYKPDKTVRINYSNNLDGANAFLKIGLNANQYRSFSIPIGGQRHQFIPDDINLRPGRYYLRITNSEAETFSNIVKNSKVNDDIFFSNEIQLIVEAQNAPRVISPRGQIQTPTPIFNWDPVQGVKAYWVILSSTPFDIVTDENDEITIQGANVIWQFITSETTAQYGDINRNTPYQVEAPPLSTNQEYSYAVLNVYEEDNPVYTSPVFGGVIPMTYVNVESISKPELVSPVEETEFEAAETITFSWTEVENAVSYTVNLYELITLQGVDATSPIWSVTTTNTQVDYPALGTLKSSEYRWNVVANDKFGGGRSSGSSDDPFQSFIYNIPVGEIVMRGFSELDNSSLVGIEVTARAITGGVTPSVPTFLQSSRASDSLVVGRYELTAKKQGFIIQKKTAEIRNEQTTAVNFFLEPLPASVSGIVVDENGRTITNANVIFTNSDNGEKFTTTTNTDGEFSFGIPAGSYNLQITKNGFISLREENVVLGADEQVNFDDNFILVNDEAVISGTVKSDENNAIDLARVILTNVKNGEQINVRSNGDGFYRTIVASGQWKIEAIKDGFVLSKPLNISVSANETLQNQNITMIGSANQISGFVREFNVDDEGNTGLAPFENVKIQATPTSGSPVSTTTNRNGTYNLSLKKGTYSIEASFPKFSSSEPTEVSLGFGETINGINFQMTPNPSTISGKVLSPAGNGLANVQIFDELDPSLTTKTSSGGFYRLTVPIGNHLINGKLKGYYSSGGNSISVSAGQELSGVDLTLVPNAVSVNGTVTSADGIVTAASVVVESNAGDRKTVKTDDNGRFDLNIQPGEWRLFAGKSGFFNSDTTVINLSPGQSRTGIDLSLVSINRLISGTITGNGNPQRDARVSLQDKTSGMILKTTRSKVDGSYSIAAETGKSYTLIIIKQNFITKRIDITNLKTGNEAFLSDVTLRGSPASVSGLITDINNIPINGADITLRDLTDSLKAQSTSNLEGKYSIDVEADRYKMIIKKQGFLTDSLDIGLNIGEKRAGLNIILEQAVGSASGTVKDQNGDVVSGAAIALLSTTSNSIIRNTRSGADGTFVISNIDPGRYYLMSTKSGFAPLESERFTIQGGQNVSRNLNMVKFEAVIQGRIQSLSGVIQSGATVFGKNMGSEGSTFTTSSDDNGNFEFSALPPGDYAIYGIKNGFSTADTTNVNVETAIDTTRDILVRLSPRVGQIFGNVVDRQNGVALSSARVIAEGVGSDEAITNTNGEFTISNLSFGTYSLTARNSGFDSDTIDVSISPENPRTNVEFKLRRNLGAIAGTVQNQIGGSLGQKINLRAIDVNTLSSFETQSDLNGDFSFEDIPNGKTYNIETLAQGRGFVNSSLNVRFDSIDTFIQLANPLVIAVNNGIIAGNSGLSAANTTLLNANNEISTIKSSQPDGSFRFEFLEENSYKITTSAEGFVFEPDTQVVDLGFNQTINLTPFNPIENSGDLLITSINSQGQPLSGVNISILSSDQTISRNGVSNSEGITRFVDLPANVTYSLFAQRDGFTVSTELPQALSIPLNGQRSIEIQLARNKFNLSGSVARSDIKTPLENVTIALTASDGSLLKSTSTSDRGTYLIRSLPSTEFFIRTSLQGFRTKKDTFSIANLRRESQNVDGDNIAVSVLDTLFLEPAFVNVSGKVLFEGNGVENAQVTIKGTEDQATQTNRNGRYIFNNYPVNFENQDTLALSVGVSFQNFQDSRLIQVNAGQRGKTVQINDFLVPSGQIDLKVLNGIFPIPDLEIFINSDKLDRPITLTSDESGTVKTSNTLRAGQYELNINTSTNNFLLPDEPFEETLESDTSTIRKIINLPYRFEPPDTIQASKPSVFLIDAPDNQIPSQARADLLYRNESSSTFDTLSLAAEKGHFIGLLPALNSLEPVEFFVQVEDSVQDIIFKSTEFTQEPSAVGLLSEVILSPRLNELLLRTNDTYTARISVKDGANNILSNAFSVEGSGIVELESSDDAIETDITDNVLKIKTGDETGRFSIGIRAKLEQQEIITQLGLNVQDIKVSTLQIQSTGDNKISNSRPFTFDYSALDTAGTNIQIGESLDWSVIPAHVGTISNGGVFTPDSTSIGTFQVQLSDQITNVSSISNPLSLTAKITPNSPARTLEFGSTLSLEIPSAAFDVPSVISMSTSKTKNIKKFTSTVDGDGNVTSFVSSDQLFRLVSAGSNLQKPARLMLRVDESLRLLDGNRKLARFNQEDLAWNILGDISVDVNGVIGNVANGEVTGQTDALGQFAVLIENKPLGLEHFSLLPNPFSPRVAPVKIGYLLNSQSPPAFVTINIYNLNGELVRQLLNRDSQMPGRYGGNSSLKSISWDGLTDTGKLARNGRYIVHIEVKDGDTSKEFMKTVVLVK